MGLKEVQQYLENEFYDKSLGVVPAREFDLPTSRASDEVGFTYINSSATPLLSSNQRLRGFSPFTMRVMPPLLYLDNPDILTNTEKGFVNMGIYDSAISNNSNFSSFINAVSSYGQPNGAVSFSVANNDDFGTSEAISVGARPTTKKSLDGTEDQMFESAITDFQVAEDMAQQLDTILKAPPITFYINPISFAISYTKKHQFTERTRYGYIYQAWGEDQPKISVSGRIGSFVAGKGNDPTVAVPTGHQFATKLDSASFQQLMALLTLYKNNGYIYDLLGRSNAHHLVGCIAIEYDGFTYFGHFDSFEWGYEETNVAGGLSYSFNFTVSRMFDNQQTSTLNVSPLKSPVPIPGNPTMNENKTPNSVSGDDRFVDRGVELQTFTQRQVVSDVQSVALRSSIEQQQAIPSGELPPISEDEEDEEDNRASAFKTGFVFNNSNGGQ